MVAAGIMSVFLLQNALQSGSIVAVQRAVTLSDPVAGIALGIFLFSDQVRLGPVQPVPGRRTGTTGCRARARLYVPPPR